MPQVILLFNHTPFAAEPWAKKGFEVHCYDRLNEPGSSVVVGNGVVHYHPWECDAQDALSKLIQAHPSPHFIGGFPPCTDLSVAGNKWRPRKLAANPNYLEDAMARLYLVRDYGEHTGAPYFIEQPVSRASTLWRKPDHRFIPADYGGYLPEDDTHPRWSSDLIPPRDAYSKKTSLWVGNGFVMPPKKPVPIVRSEITCTSWWKDWEEEKIFRSATPRGFAEAVAEHNS
jgi:hypothetical protein